MRLKFQPAHAAVCSKEVFCFWKSRKSAVEVTLFLVHPFFVSCETNTTSLSACGYGSGLIIQALK